MFLLPVLFILKNIRYPKRYHIFHGFLRKEKRFILSGDAATPVACMFFSESNNKQYKKPGEN